MTAASEGPVRFAEFLAAHLPEAAREMVAVIVRSVPDYEQLPRELVEQDLVHRAEENLRLFVRLLGEGRSRGRTNWTG